MLFISILQVLYMCYCNLDVLCCFHKFFWILTNIDIHVDQHLKNIIYLSGFDLWIQYMISNL